VSINERVRYLSREMSISIDEARKKLADVGLDKHDSLTMSSLNQMYDLAWENGRTAGYREAKGRKSASKKPGRPRTFEEEIECLCAWADLRRQEDPGTGVREALRYCLKIMQLGEREVLEKGEGSTPNRRGTTPDTARRLRKKYQRLTISQVERAYWRRRRRGALTS
jgi:hypothetical protein